MIVIFNANMFGLSTLHQLRGRVGRSNKQAYAYIMYKKDKLLSEVADKRLKAIKELKKIINNEQYEIIHCHTPMGSVVTRLAAKKARKKYHTRVIYTAHGFHFYKGASLLNWLLFYPNSK